MAQIKVALQLLQALLQTLCLPLHLVRYWFSRKTWQKQIYNLLQQQTAPTDWQITPQSNQRLKGKKIFISVGDISAEPHALRLMQELNHYEEDIEWLGFGGQKMAAAGCKILFNPVQRAVIGFRGLAQQIPAHTKALYEFHKVLATAPPDLLILLDYPGFHLQLAKAAAGHVPVFYYLCPQLWAWAPWRLPGFKKWVKRAFCIFPFEAKFFSAHGVQADFVGHPIADHLQDLEKIPLAANPPVLALLPGSRSKEVKENLPAMLRLSAKLRQDFPEIKIVIPHERSELVAEIKALCAQSTLPIEIRERGLHSTLQNAHLVLAKSGTAILEVAHFEVPMLVIYKLPGGWRGKFAEWVKRNFLITPFFTSVNLLAGKKVIPEYAYASLATEQFILQELKDLWIAGPKRQTCIAALAQIRKLYDLPGTAARTAALILQELK